MLAQRFGSRRPRRAPLGFAAVIAVLVLAVAPAMASAAPDIRYLAFMDGDQEVPGPGDADGSGFAQIGINSTEGSICWTVDYVDVDGTLTGMHIHDGDPGEAGPIVVTLTLAEPESGTLSACADGIDSGVLAAIEADPGGHYINLHSDSFPAGAIRGQIEAFPTLELSVSVWICPDGVGPSDVTAFPDSAEECTPVLHSLFDDLPDGFTWVPTPFDFDWEIDFTDADGFVLNEFDLLTFGDPSCDGVAMTCSPPRNAGLFFDPYFDDAVVLAGPSSIEALNAPTGYTLGFADAWVEEDGWEPLAIDLAGAIASFDTSDAGRAHVRLFYSTGLLPPPSPGPSLTPPATTTSATSGDLETGSSGAFLAIGLVLVASSLIVVTRGVRAKRA